MTDAADTVDRYRQTLQAVAQIGDFFNLVQPEPDGIPLRQLIESNGVYEERIAGTTRTLSRLLGAEPEQLPRRAVASLVFLGLAARLVAPALASAALYGLVPELTLDSTTMAELPDGRVVLRLTAFATLNDEPSTDPANLADLISRQLMQGPIRQLVTTFAARDALHPRLLWGNVASTVASSAPLVTQHHAGYANTIQELTAGLLSTQELAECGTVSRDRETLHFQRQSCCLYYKFSRAGTCGDCPLPSQARLV